MACHVALYLLPDFFLCSGSPFLEENTTVEQMELANEKYGLDKPLIVQLKNYLEGYLHGDLGTSLKMQKGTPGVKLINIDQEKDVSVASIAKVRETSDKTEEDVLKQLEDELNKEV